MMYPDLSFPKPNNRPYFYTNFVSTVDGKVVVTKNPKAYWPIGSETDHATMAELRSHADCLIHGTATASGHSTLDSLHKPEFRAMRTKNDKSADLPYVIIGSHFDESLYAMIENVQGIPVTLATTAEADVTAPKGVSVERFGSSHADLHQLSSWLFAKGYEHVLVEGGPHIMGSFFEAGLIDEVFLTLAPKIFGNSNKSTMTMVEGYLFAADKVPNLELVSAKPHENEVYLRYKVNF